MEKYGMAKLLRDDDQRDRYAHRETDEAWEGWQARAEIAVPKPETWKCVQRNYFGEHMVFEGEVFKGVIPDKETADRIVAAMNALQAGRPVPAPLGFCDRFPGTGTTPHTKCNDCLNWREVAE